MVHLHILLVSRTFNFLNRTSFMAQEYQSENQVYIVHKDWQINVL